VPAIPDPLPTSGQNPLVSPPSGSGVVPTPLGPTPGNPDVDLATISFVTAVLAAGNVTPTTAQAGVMPALITAASREMLRFMGRRIVAHDCVEIVGPEGGRFDRGEPATAKLRGFPIAGVNSVMTGRVTALTVRNTASSTNQVATVALITTGDAEQGDLVSVGLALRRVASGVTTTDRLYFAEHPTMNALAAAIAGLSGGWTATVQGANSTPNLGLWSPLDLVGARTPKDALHGGASLDVFATPASDCDVDPSTGIVRFHGGCSGGFGRGSDYGFEDFGSGGWGFGAGQYRVSYRSGWETVPEQLQMVVAEVVRMMFTRLKTNTEFKSQSGSSGDENWSWTIREMIPTMPEWAMQTLMLYKDWSI
jgi:hypothetical protein